MTGRKLLRGKMMAIRAAAMAMAVVATMGMALPASAQVDEARIRKVEAEVRALQRKVFPGGDGRFFETNAVGPEAAGASPPATTAMTDMLARLDALEARLASITAQVETNTNALALLSGRVAALEPQTAATIAPAPVALQSGVSSAPQVASAAPAQAKPAPPSAERLAKVQAIAKPDTGDAGEDEYSYGFRLWDAKLYPEAQQQLRLFVEKYPSHSRISYGRNLLGRAYLDDGKPKEAATWFVQNYQKDKQGARAGDSLLYLAESMIQIGDTKRACIALAEFGDTYPALATGRLKTDYDTNLKKVKCN